jgi:DNA adenine methylase
MKYMGSKRRIAHHILPLVLADRKPGQWYVEPFCGGCNMLEHVDNPRLASDAQQGDQIRVRELQTQVPFAPPPVSETAYKAIRDNKEGFPAWLVGYAGFPLSFGAKWFGGMARSGGKEAHRDHAAEAVRNLHKQAPKLAGVDFRHGSYLDLPIPPNSIIYCDPPYRGTTGYKAGAFCHDTFYLWCHEQARAGHQVFISEYDMPREWFRCVWEGEVALNLDNTKAARRAVERIFVPIL